MERPRRWIRALSACVTVLASALVCSTASATLPGANGRIVYLGNDGVHTVLPSGQGDMKLPNTLAQLTWSPNGRRIAGIRYVGDYYRTEIYSMRADGTDLRRLTRRRGGDNAPAYASGGHRIVFTSTGTSSPWVMTMRTDGSDLRRLGRGVAYQWSIDGRWITYVAEGTGHEPNGIWEMHPNGTDKHRLVLLGRGGGSFADFSPDGTHFLFTRCGFEDCHWLVARTDGSHVHPSPCDHVASYSPDGKWFLGGDEDSFGRPELVRFSVATCAEHLIARNVFEAAAWQSLQPG